MAFTKLDQGILQSSIMAADPELFKVWIALLASCDPDGIARVAPTFIAAVCHMGLEETRGCFHRLTEPDPDSRTPDHEGRRIRRVDGGWEIINYRKYRLRGRDENTREYERERKRQQRAGRNVRDMSRTEPGHSPSYSLSSSLEGESEGERFNLAERAILDERRKLELELGSLLAKLAEHENSRLMVPAWCRKVTSYQKGDKQVGGVADFRGRLSIERLEKSVSDAKWWLEKLEAGNVVGEGQ